jgi:toxin CcdB
MAQFDVHKNPGGGEFPLVLDVQANLLAQLSTRAVVPMAKLQRFGTKPISRLNPTARIDGVEYVLVFQELAAVDKTTLGSKVASLASRRAELVAALDLLFTGI